VGLRISFQLKSRAARPCGFGHQVSHQLGLSLAKCRNAALGPKAEIVLKTLDDGVEMKWTWQRAGSVRGGRVGLCIILRTVGPCIIQRTEGMQAEWLP
jgi:hypothetical protein